MRRVRFLPALSAFFNALYESSSSVCGLGFIDADTAARCASWAGVKLLKFRFLGAGSGAGAGSATTPLVASNAFIFATLALFPLATAFALCFPIMSFHDDAVDISTYWH